MARRSKTALEIELTAETKQLKKDMRVLEQAVLRANKRVESQQKQSLKRQQQAQKRHVNKMKSITSKLPVGKLLGFAAALGSVTKAYGAMMEQMDRADETAKMARNLGVGFEALQKLQVAFGDAGVEAEQFTKALSKFNTVVGAAAAGEKTYLAAFETLGIHVRDANGQIKDTESLFYEVADAISSMGLSAAEEADLMKDLFGVKVGIRMLGLLRQGSEEIRRQGDVAEEVGRIMEESIGKAAEESKDALSESAQKTETAWAEAMASMSEEIVLLNQAWDLLSRAMATAVGWLGKLSDIWRSMGFGLTETEEEVHELEGELEKVNSQIKAQREYLKGMGSFFGLMTLDAEARAAWEARTAELLQRQLELRTKIEALKTPKAPAAQPTEAAATPAAQPTEAAATPGSPQPTTPAELDALIKRERQRAENKRAKAAREQYKEEAQRVADEMDTIADKTKEVSEYADMMDGHFNTALDDMLDGTKDFKDAFSDMARSVVMDLTKMIAKQMIFNAISSLFGGSPTGGGGGFSITSALGFARGGPVQAYRPIMVGENGPEPFVPAVDGRVLSKQQAQQAITGGAGGRGSIVVNQTLNFALGVQDTVRAEIENMKPELVNASTQGVIEARLRGGRMASAFS